MTESMFAKKMEISEMPRTLSAIEKAQAVRQQLAELAKEIASTSPVPELRALVESLAENVKKIHFGGGAGTDESAREDSREAIRRWQLFQRALADWAESLLASVKTTIATSTGGEFQVASPVLENHQLRVAHVADADELVKQIDTLLASAERRASNRADAIAANVRALDSLGENEVGRCLISLWRVVADEGTSALGPAGRRELAQKLKLQLETNMAHRAPGLNLTLLRASMVARSRP